MATIVFDQLLDTRPGRHAIYVEAVDSDGIVGHVTAAWFEIIEACRPIDATCGCCSLYTSDAADDLACVDLERRSMRQETI